MSRTSGFFMTDRAIGGKLAKTLHAYQKEGLSFFEMAVRLRDDHDVAVSPSTVKRWIQIADEQ
jgi:intein-encoded DNA endonuclease-like protein